MSVEMLVKGAIEVQMTDLAQRVLSDLKAEVGKHNRSGEAQGSISILENSIDHVLIGGRNLHLYYLDQGNGGKGRRIYPTKSKALYLKDYGIYRGSVSGYDGFHVARTVADKYR